MKNAFLKTTFVLMVLVLTLILVFLASLVLDNVSVRDRLPLGILVLGGSMFVADRSIASLFRLARLTDKRWSVFNSRGRY